MAGDTPRPAQPATEDTAPAPGPGSARPKRRWRRVVLAVAGAAVLLILLAVLLLPQLLSTPPGRRLVTNAINGGIAGRVAIDGLSLGWFGGQRLTGVELYDPSDALVARFREIAAPDLGLLPVAFGSRAFGDVRVDAEAIDLRQAPGQPTNLELALASPGAAQQPAPSPPSQPSPSPAEPTALGDASVRLEFTADRIGYESPGDAAQGIAPLSVQLPDVRATAEVPSLRDIHLVLQSGLRHGEQTGKIDADVAVSDAFTPAGVLALEAARVEGRVELVNLPVAMVDGLAQQGGSLLALLGENLDATVRTEGELEDLSAELTASSDRLNVDTRLRRTATGLEASGGAASLTITPEAFVLLTADPRQPAPPEAEAMRLLQPVTLRADLSSLVVPTGPDGAAALGDARMNATVTAERIALFVPGQGDVAVEGLELGVESSRLSERVVADLAATARLAGAAEPVSARAEVANLLSDRPLQATLTSRRFPVALADAVAGQNGNLARTLGATLDATVNVTQGKDGYQAEGTLEAPNLRGPFAATYGVTGAVAFRTPEPLRFTATPEGVSSWTARAAQPADEAAGTPATPAGPGWTVAEPAEVAIDVRSFTMPGGPEGADVAGAEVDAAVTSARVTLVDPATRARIPVENLSLSAAGTVGKLLEVLATADTGPGKPDGPRGTIRSETRIANLVGAGGELAPAGAEITGKTLVKDVPSGLIDALAAQEGQLAAVLGPATSAGVDLNFRGEQGGRANVELDSANVKSTIAARVSPKGVVRLNRDAEFAVNVTPEVSRVMLAKVTPLLASVAAAEVPVKLTVSAEDFTLPLTGFDWRRVNARASLDPVEITLDSRTGIGGIFELLKRANVISERDFIGARLSTLQLAIDRGRMRYDDFRLTLSDDVSLGFGGLVDLAAGRYDLQMAISGSGVPGSGVRVPIQGSLDNPSISTEALTKALVGAGVQRGLQELLGGQRRREEPRGDEPIGRDPNAPVEGTREGEERPRERRDPLGGLLDIVEQELRPEEDKPAEGEAR